MVGDVKGYVFDCDDERCCLWMMWVEDGRREMVDITCFWEGLDNGLRTDFQDSGPNE